jgi:hypothetical protein
MPTDTYLKYSKRRRIRMVSSLRRSAVEGYLGGAPEDDMKRKDWQRREKGARRARRDTVPETALRRRENGFYTLST